MHQLAADWLQNVSHLIFSGKPNISDGLLMIGVPVVLLIAWSTFQMISKSHLRQWLLPVLLCVVPAAVFVLSDLVLGGQSSVVARYFLPTFIGTVLILGFGISPSPANSQPRAVARAARPSWKQVLFYTVLTITLSTSWYSLHAFTWWEGPDRDRQTIREISQVSSVATIVSDLDIGSFTEFALFLRPTDYVLWLKSGDGVPYEIFDEAAATFLLEPSDDLFKRVIRAAAERQFVVEPLQSHLFQIKHSA